MTTRTLQNNMEIKETLYLSRNMGDISVSRTFQATAGYIWYGPFPLAL
jgi:hypothetical protein